MNTDRSQRWRERRDLYRPAGEVFDPSRFDVQPIASDTVAREFLERHHYLGGMGAAVHRYGLYHKAAFLREELVGVAVLGVPANDHVIPAWAPGLHPREGLDLNRFVLRDECADGTPIAGNAETWFLRHVFEQLKADERRLRQQAADLARGVPLNLPSKKAARLRAGRAPLRIVVAYSDPMPRRDLDGALTMPGHIGDIYKAFSGRHVGRARRRKILLTPNGCTLDERGRSKLAAALDPVKGRGNRYVYEQLQTLGLPTRTFGEAPKDYLDRALAEGVRRGVLREVEHPGNLVYAWPLTNAGRDALRSALPYPTLAEFGLPVEP